MRLSSGLALLPALALTACSLETLSPLQVSREERVAQELSDLGDDPVAVAEFLKTMPKGGDLHNHLYGSIQPETLVRWGNEDGLCINTTTFSASSSPCAEGSVAMSEATPGSELQRDIVAAWSLLGFEGDVFDRHEHFFDTFGLFYPVIGKHRFPEGMAEAMRAAADNGQSYLELQHDFDSYVAGYLAIDLMDAKTPWDEAYLLSAREALLAEPTFIEAVQTSRADIAAWAAGTDEFLRCGTALEEPACNVGVQWLMSACRIQTKEYVFGQWVFAYELAQVSPSMVGLNIVKPEEDSTSLAAYEDEMAALAVLRTQNQSDPSRAPVRVSLHAGELSAAFLSAEDQHELTYHIRRAVEVGGAERIGHGVSVLSETEGEGPIDLMNEMSETGVAVEICLTSNDLLLDAVGDKHPLNAYREHGVPVSLSTDDGALFGSNITDDYTRAVVDQGLDYPALKEVARASIEYSFLPGDSLWATRGDYTTMALPCEGVDVEAPPEGACATLLQNSPRAEQGFRLERDLAAFERERAGR